MNLICRSAALAGVLLPLVVSAAGAQRTPVAATTGEAPAGLTATAADARTVDLAWSPARDAAGYRVLRATSLEGPFEVITPRPITATSFRDENLTPRTTYAYQVQAVFRLREPVTSAAVSVTTPPDLTVLPGLRDGITFERPQLEVYDPGPGEPGAPTGASAVALGPTSVRVSWQPASGAGGYQVSAGLSIDGPWVVRTRSRVTSTSFTDDGLAPDLTLFYRVEAWYPDEQAPQVAPTESVVIQDQTGQIVGGRIVPVHEHGEYLASQPVRVTTPTSPLTGFAAATGPNPGTITFAWSPVAGAIHYAITGPGIPGGSVAVTGTTHVTHHVPPGTHTYRIAASHEIAGLGTFSTPEHQQPVASVTVPGPTAVQGWQIVSREEVVAPGSGTGTVTVSCPTGKRALGGGYRVVAPSWLTTQRVRRSGPTADGSGWVFEVQDETGGPGRDPVSVAVSVICGLVG
jgi:hypothetical protein